MYICIIYKFCLISLILHTSHTNTCIYNNNYAQIYIYLFVNILFWLFLFAFPLALCGGYNNYHWCLLLLLLLSVSVCYVCFLCVIGEYKYTTLGKRVCTLKITLTLKKCYITTRKKKIVKSPRWNVLAN